MTNHEHTRIDINCDLGEGQSLTDCQNDAQLMPFISRCNIACGGHAGDSLTMRQTLLNARKHDLKAGAHPGYPDRENFGRQSIKMPFKKLAFSIQEQINLLKAIAQSESIQLTHIKCHGALYNDAENNPELASKLLDLFHETYPELSILGLANGQMERAARRLGHAFIKEGFMDRAYQTNGKLVPRSEAGAVFEDIEQAVCQALFLAQGRPINSIEKEPLKLQVDSICLHGDNTHAVQVAETLFNQLKQQGVHIE